MEQHCTWHIGPAWPAAAGREELGERAPGGLGLPAAWRCAAPEQTGTGARSPACPGAVPRTAAGHEEALLRSLDVSYQEALPPPAAGQQRPSPPDKRICRKIS